MARQLTLNLLLLNYVGMVDEQCGHDGMECISICVHSTSCWCTLSASAFIELALYQLDFFLEIFLWTLVYLKFNLHNHTVARYEISKSAEKINT